MGVRHGLDSFGADALDAQVEGGSSRDAVVRTAARYYLADRGSGRIAWRPPPFLRATGRRASAVADVELDDETMEALEEEARRQGLAPDVLAEHALLYYLADLDRVRAATRMSVALNGNHHARSGDRGDRRRTEFAQRLLDGQTRPVMQPVD